MGCNELPPDYECQDSNHGFTFDIANKLKEPSVPKTSDEFFF